MNAHALAEDGASRYLESIDLHQPHSQNVNIHLRELVKNLTKKILCDDVGVVQETSILGSKVELNGIGDNGDDGDDENKNSSNLIMSTDDETNDENSVNKKGKEKELTLSKRSKARMKAFLQNCAMAVSDDPLPNHAYSTVINNSIHKIQKTGQEQNLYYPQFLHQDITIRLEIYFRSLKRVRDYNGGIVRDIHNSNTASIRGKSLADQDFECLVALEPPRVIQARTDALVRSFVNGASSVRSIRPLLTALVLGLTMEVLAVDLVGKEITQKIHRLVSEYEHLTSFASLAFLSSPEEAADTHLSSLILNYLHYLQSTYKMHIASAEIESMLSNVLNPKLRQTFQNTEFQSLGHLLHVCEIHSDMLQNIKLPPIRNFHAITSKCSNPKDVKQALKDLRREIITVNGTVIPPAHSLKELVRLLSETLNARTTTLYSSSSSGRTISSNTVRIESDSDESEHEKYGVSSGNEGDSESHGRHRARFRQNKGVERGTRKRSFDGATVDKMTARLLIAAGRSGTGADAYFAIQDLFGGEGVIVVPSRSQPKLVPDRRSSRTTRKKVSNGTIDIIVRLTSVTIKIHANYDVYPEKNLSDAGCEPLIQLHSTTTETIALQEVRVHEVGSHDTSQTNTLTDTDIDTDIDTDEQKLPHDNNGFNDTGTLILREKKTASTGKRILSIRPASYKKVEIWNTPS